jgi:hypothetical protein
VITSILDPAEAGAQDLAALYNERWEIAESFKQMECRLRPSRVPLRSETPYLVEQEIWGPLPTQNAVRPFVANAADTAHIDPDRLPAVRAPNTVRRSIIDRAVFAPSLKWVWGRFPVGTHVPS